MSDHKLKTPKLLALEKKSYQHISPTGIITALKKAGGWLRSAIFLKTPGLLAGQAAAKPFPQIKKSKKVDNRVRAGSVKFFNRSKGFGFIRDENGVEIYVHNSGLKSRISENDTVTFELERNERGLNAVNVALSYAQKKRVNRAQNNSHNITEITGHLF